MPIQFFLVGYCDFIQGEHLEKFFQPIHNLQYIMRQSLLIPSYKSFKWKKIGQWLIVNNAFLEKLF